MNAPPPRRATETTLRDATDSMSSPPAARSAARIANERAAEAPKLEDLRVRPALDSGRSLEIESPGDGTDRLVVRGTSGEVELDVTLTADGPRLCFRSAELTLETEGKLSVRCDELDVRAQGKIYQESASLDQRVAGDARVSVRGELRQRALETEIRSLRGNVEIAANDDVRLVGERVKLNPGEHD
jgi:hypothetical protein